MKIKKYHAKASVKTLDKKYTFEQSQDINDLTPVDVYDEIAQQLTEEINNEILSELYTSMGWIMVQRQLHNDWPQPEITSWLKQNCTMNYFQASSFCQFASKADAILFQLTWT